MADESPSRNGSRSGLFERLYAELRQLAKDQAKLERGTAVQPTSLVHKVWLRWNAGKNPEAMSREAFLGIVSRIMRQVLVDQARARAALKRGGGASMLRLDESALDRDPPRIDLLALDEALNRLDRLHPRQRRVVEMMFFSGMTQTEVASALQLSERTVRGDWISAHAWLRAELAQ